MAKKHAHLHWNIEAHELLPSHAKLHHLSELAAEATIETIRERTKEGRFGPKSRGRFRTYSTRPYFFDTELPRGGKGRLRAFARSRGVRRPGRYVKIPGGYAQYHGIFRGESPAEKPNLQLTGEMMRRMEETHSVSSKGSVEIGVTFPNTKSAGQKLSPAEKAEIHNNDGVPSNSGRVVRQFVYLSLREARKIVRDAFKGAGLPYVRKR